MLKNIKDYQEYKYILHRGDQQGVILIAFKGVNHDPSHLIKIYDISQKPHLDLMRGVMDKISAHSSPILNKSIPRWLECRAACSHYIIYEEYAKGMPMSVNARAKDIFWMKNFNEDLSLVVEWISRLHKDFRGGVIRISADAIAAVTKKVKELADVSFLRIPSGDIAVEAVVFHGDFRPKNIVKEIGRISVIDWDRMRPAGVPLFDLLQFIFHYVHSHYRLQKEKVDLTPEVFLKYLNLFYFEKKPLSDIIKNSIESYSETIGLDVGRRDLLLLLWIYLMFYPPGRKDSILLNI